MGILPETPKSLNRELRFVDAIAVGLGAIIGAGIFVVSGIAAGIAGPAVVLSLVLAAIVATFNALSSAELAARYPNSGGTYEYGYEVLHPWAGFSAGWMFLASKLAAGGTVAIGFGGYLAALAPAVSPQGAGIAAVSTLTVANFFGVKKVGKLNVLIVSVTVASLAYFIASGVPSFRAEQFTPFFPGEPQSVLHAAGLLFFAFTGYARIATLGEEVVDPQKTIPRAIIASLVISVLLYILVVTVAIGVVGPAALALTSSPLTIAAARTAVPGTVIAVGIGATTAMLGVLLSQVLGISRMMLAMARRGDLPLGLNHVNPKHAVPDRAILLTGVIILLLTIFGSLTWIVNAATFTILVYYAITNLAATRLDRSAKLFPKWIAWAGLGTCLLLAANLQLATVMGGLLLLGVGFATRAIQRSIVRVRTRSK